MERLYDNACYAGGEEPGKGKSGTWTRYDNSYSYSGSRVTRDKQNTIFRRLTDDLVCKSSFYLMGRESVLYRITIVGRK